MIGDSNTKGPCADRNANVLKILDVLTHYQRCDIAINNFRIYNNVNNQRLIKVDRDSLDSEELLEMKESKILSKKPFIYGGSTALAFLVVAAALHFSSSKPAVQMVVLVFTAASIFSGLTVGLVTYYYIRPNQKLENMGISESAQEQQFVRQL